MSLFYFEIPHANRFCLVVFWIFRIHSGSCTEQCRNKHWGYVRSWSFSCFKIRAIMSLWLVCFPDKVWIQSPAETGLFCPNTLALRLIQAHENGYQTIFKIFWESSGRKGDYEGIWSCYTILYRYSKIGALS